MFIACDFFADSRTVRPTCKGLITQLSRGPEGTRIHALNLPFSWGFVKSSILDHCPISEKRFMQKQFSDWMFLNPSLHSSLKAHFLQILNYQQKLRRLLQSKLLWSVIFKVITLHFKSHLTFSAILLNVLGLKRKKFPMLGLVVVEY